MIGALKRNRSSPGTPAPSHVALERVQPREAHLALQNFDAGCDIKLMKRSSA